MSKAQRRRAGRLPDPTLVRNQPALRTSSGSIWIIVASVFTAVSLVPLVGIVAEGGAAATVAMWTAVIVVCLLAAMVLMRLTVRPGPPRLRALAVCFIAMAAVALIGVATCVMIVWAPLRA
ncbi:hypothetical protein [Microbacterium sp. SD291]|uniref:hypothetical protein n=1 Tax=Microbacterium sp. SD291 TaxID=2782007 RepID=UPI001A967D6E|nr:hypothetical protein [Microbacterium sp. SD291]MBO0979062.1 hypothetical protein [Microbacterium sp. SD291]